LHAGSFETFYAATYRRLVGQIFALLGDVEEAEDVVQDAFARAWFHWRRIRAYDSPEAWVRRVAFNQAFNSTRRARRRLAALARHGPEPEVPALSADRADVHRAMARVPLRQRQVLVLAYVVGLSLEEIAAQLRLPLGTVKSRLARGRQRLAEQLGETYEGIGHG
jgi:RNA polymerase sigma-70 factor (ECF subfamily)